MVFSHGEHTFEVPFDDLSDGERVIIALYCLLMDMEKTPGTLLLDDPENYVRLSVNYSAL